MKAVLAAAALVLVSACSSTSGSSAPAGPTATFTDVYAMLYPTTTNARCNFCHGLPANDRSNGNLSMGNDKAAAYAALVGKAAAGSACKDRMLVVAGQPENSLMLMKLSENPACGSRMPLGGNLLTDPQREMVRSWIAAGAKDD